MERITDAFRFPLRDPHWPGKLLVIALILIVPVVGLINAVGWMLATIDRLRAGDESLPPAGIGYIGRGAPLFVVDLVYALAIAALAAAFYIPAVVLFVHEGSGAGSLPMASIGLLLSSVTLAVVTLGSLALNFAAPAIVLAVQRDGIRGGLRVGRVVRQALASFSNTLIAGLMLIAAGFVSSAGIVVCGAGVFVTAAYAFAMQAWIVRSYELGSGTAEPRRE